MNRQVTDRGTGMRLTERTRKLSLISEELRGVVRQSLKLRIHKTILGIRLRPRCCPLVSHRVYDLLVSTLLDRLCENMTSSTKPEVHRVLHCCQLVRVGPSHDHNMCRKFCAVWTCVFWGRPFVKLFILYYQSVFCLSCLSVCL